MDFDQVSAVGWIKRMLTDKNYGNHLMEHLIPMMSSATNRFAMPIDLLVFS
jgi:hypothetical protein